jgi:hypothetical protein
MTVEPAGAVVDDEVQQRPQTLACQMSERGVLHNPQWRRVSTTVRRHVFLPRYLHDDQPEPWSVPTPDPAVNGPGTIRANRSTTKPA